MCIKCVAIISIYKLFVICIAECVCLDLTEFVALRLPIYNMPYIAERMLSFD